MQKLAYIKFHWSVSRSDSQSVQMVVLCLFCAVFFARFLSFVLSMPLCYDIISPSSHWSGFPQVAVEPRRAPQKRRLMGSTDLPSCCGTNHVGIIVPLWMLNHPRLERCFWTTGVRVIPFASDVDPHFCSHHSFLYVLSGLSYVVLHTFICIYIYIGVYTHTLSNIYIYIN